MSILGEKECPNLRLITCASMRPLTLSTSFSEDASYVRPANGLTWSSASLPDIPSKAVRSLSAGSKSSYVYMNTTY